MKTKNRSMIGVVAAVLLVLVGGLLLWRNSDSAETEAAEAPVEQVDVLVAAIDIPRGVSATEMFDNVFTYARITQIPADQFRPTMITDPSQIEELGLSRYSTAGLIPVGTQLTIDMFAIPGETQYSPLEDIDENLFEVTIAIDPQRALGGFVFPGDYVAVVGSFEPGDGEPGQTVVVLERVLVTDVRAGQPLTQASISDDPFAQGYVPSGSRYITFGVEVEQLERLTWAAEFGRLWLARQGDVATVDESQVRDRDDVVLTLDELDEGREDSDEDADESADESDDGQN